MSRTLASAFKRLSLHISHRLGLSRVMRDSAWRRSRLLVLCYHGVSLNDEHRWHPQLYVSQEQLRRRFELLRRHDCTVMPLGEAAERLSRSQLPERAVVLTFDDGYYDFLARAHPLLREFGYPATVYLPTTRCGHPEPVSRLFMSYLLWLRRDRTLNGDGIPGLERMDYPLATASDRALIVRKLDAETVRARLKRSEKDALARLLAERLGVDAAAAAGSRVLTLMNSDEVRRVSADSAVRIDIELHTHSHRAPEDAALFRREIVENRERIQAMTGSRPRHFCYPSGVYSLSHLPVLRDEGVSTATTCDPGLAEAGMEPLLMPRFVDTMGVSDAEFEAWVTGAAPWLASAPLVAGVSFSTLRGQLAAGRARRPSPSWWPGASTRTPADAPDTRTDRRL